MPSRFQALLGAASLALVGLPVKSVQLARPMAAELGAASPAQLPELRPVSLPNGYFGYEFDAAASPGLVVEQLLLYFHKESGFANVQQTFEGGQIVMAEYGLFDGTAACNRFLGQTCSEAFVVRSVADTTRGTGSKVLIIGTTQYLSRVARVTPDGYTDNTQTKVVATHYPIMAQIGGDGWGRLVHIVEFVASIKPGG